MKFKKPLIILCTVFFIGFAGCDLKDTFKEMIKVDKITEQIKGVETGDIGFTPLKNAFRNNSYSSNVTQRDVQQNKISNNTENKKANIINEGISAIGLSIIISSLIAPILLFLLIYLYLNRKKYSDTINNLLKIIEKESMSDNQIGAKRIKQEVKNLSLIDKNFDNILKPKIRKINVERYIKGKIK